MIIAASFVAAGICLLTVQYLLVSQLFDQALATSATKVVQGVACTAPAPVSDIGVAQGIVTSCTLQDPAGFTTVTIDGSAPAGATDLQVPPAGAARRGTGRCRRGRRHRRGVVRGAVLGVGRRRADPAAGVFRGGAAGLCGGRGGYRLVAGAPLVETDRGGHRDGAGGVHHRSAPAAGTAGAAGRDQGARRHHRRHAGPVGVGLRGAGSVRGQRLSRTAHAVDHIKDGAGDPAGAGPGTDRPATRGADRAEGRRAFRSADHLAADAGPGAGHRVVARNSISPRSSTRSAARSRSGSPRRSGHGTGPAAHHGSRGSDDDHPGGHQPAGQRDPAQRRRWPDLGQRPRDGDRCWWRTPGR